MANINGGEQIFAALFKEYGATLTLEQVSFKILKFKKIKSAYTARKRGKYPIRFISLGGKLGHSIVDVVEYLVTGQPQSQLDSPVTPVAKRPGRPRKVRRTSPNESMGGSHDLSSK